MNLFNLSSAQKMLLFSEINDPLNDSFYLNFRKDYALEDFEYVKSAIETICKSYLTLQIMHDENGDFKQYYVDVNDFNVETFNVSDENINDFIRDYLDNPFDEFFDSPLYKWAVLKTDSATVLIGVVHHILLDGTSLFSIIPQEIEKYIENRDSYVPIDYSYENYVDAELDYLKSSEASEDKKYWLNTLKSYSQDWYSFDKSRLGFYEMILDKTYEFDYSPFVTSLALNFLYLSRCKMDNEQFKDMVLNTSVHGRYFGQDDALGMFVNTIPLRLEYDEDLTFDELLAYSKKVLKEGLSHAKLQFSEYATDLRNDGIDPGCISMLSIVSNSTDFDSKFLTLQKDLEFPLHFRINKNYSDKEGLQSIFIEYDKSCFTKIEIKSMAKGLKDLFKQVCDDSTKRCGDYDVNVIEFFRAENYYNNLINSFDNPTSISPDVNGNEVSYKLISKAIDVKKLKNLSNDYNLSKEKLLLAAFLFNLTKFSFSKDILIAYNKLACGYHFNTDLSVNEYLNDFKKYFREYPSYPLLNNRKLNFESEILYFNDDYSKKDYKFMFNFESGKINVNYDESYYSKELIDAFLDSMDVLFDRFSSPDDALKDISIRRDLELDEDFKIELANEGLVNEMFENIASKNPQKTILYAEDGELTYEELNRKANKIANALIKRGVNVEDRIMFMMRRYSDLIASVMGIVKAGAAFIPIDPNYPKNRINQILEDSDSRFVITSSEIEYDGDNRIDVDELLNEADDSNPDVNLTPDNLCFLIYTSGSTGKPKGVMITHKGITNYVANVSQNVPIYELNNKCNKFISISTVSFIVFLREIFGTILNGLPVVFANDEEAIDPLKLVELFKSTGAEGFGSTPTRLLEYLQIDEIQDVIGSCNVIIVGGEGFPPVLYDRMRKYTDADIYNSYGPTEVTIASHYKLMDSNKVTAGWPMLNVVDKVMDIDGNQLPAYVSGEIYVGGAGISRGYLNNPEQTEKVFLTLNDIPYYNTGDLGKKDDAGELYVLGRNDTQIKLRGLRIELSEIEGAIANYENITLSKVVVKKINSIEHLCAYFTATSDIYIDDLKEHLTDSLPEYMVPSYFTQLDEFPKTPNGKTDFKNLPDPVISDEDIILPRNDIEQEIYDIVLDIIGAESISVNANLFASGLTSLSVIKLTSGLYKKLNVQLNVTDILKYKSIAEIAYQIRDNATTEYEKMEYYPLTSNQLGVYFDCMRDPENLAYNLPKMMNFEKDIDSEKLKSSIIKAINNHPYLKTRVVMKDGEIYQKRNDDASIDDLIEITENADVDEFVRPFNLDGGELFRFQIVGSKMLLADFHHIIVDGTSLNLLFDEIAKIYDGKDYEAEEMDGYEYSLSEVNVEKSERFTEAQKFFEDKIKEFDEPSLITQDISGDASLANVKTKDINIDKNIIDRFCAEKDISQNNLFLAAVSFVCSKFVYDKNLLIATITNGRFTPNQQRTLAMMVKTLPLALKLNSDLTINEYFSYINSEWLDVLTNSSYPLTKIANDFEITPEIFYAYHGKIVEDIEMDGMQVKRESIDVSGEKFKVSINVKEVDGMYNVFCEYNDQLYSDELIETMLDSINVILNKFQTLTPDTQLKNISISHEDNWTEDDLEYIDIGEKRVNRIFESCVNDNGEDVAVYATDGTYTFNQLNSKANSIANALIKHGVGIEDNVMIILNRNSNFIASMFGILKAGAAFIPIDSDYPKDRIEHVLTDSQSKYIIVDDIVEKKNIDLADYSEHLLDVNELLKEENTDNPDTGVKPNNLAYLIYTSGSTGLPKGVMLEHQNLANFAYPHPDNVYTYELATNYKKEDYRVLSTTTVAFDVFLEEVMCSLLNGVPLVLADDESYKDPKATLEFVKKYKANVYTATPSRILQYLQLNDVRDEMYKFKVYAIAGEPFPIRLYEMLSENTDAKIFNVYGPTEATISCNTALLENENITVGWPLFNVKERIMDQDSNPLPDNVIGELYIAGEGVSRAYHNRPENNRKAYVTINGIRYYKSGDFAKRASDGLIYVYGRLDNQIKLRGLRIELGEIESAISKHEAVKDIAVVVRNINDNDYLCAYYTVYDEYKKDDVYSIDIEALKEKLEEDLVYYMVPTFFTELDEFPRTPNDKIDSKNLPEPQMSLDDYIAPRNDVEQGLWDILSEILNITTFGVDTDLFNIGLTSLTMMNVVSEIYERFNTQLMITQLMKNKTIEKIAGLIDEEDIGESEEHESYPLSQNQLGVYFECVKNPEDLSYNMPIKIEFGSDIDPLRLKSSIVEAIDMHPYLKTRIIMRDGEVYQERRDELKIDNLIEIVDEEVCEKGFAKPFVLDEGPLFRFKIFKDTVLLADFHHLLIDGTSMNLFFEEVARIYDGTDFPEELMDGYEYSLNESKIEKSNLYKEAELFFFDKLKEFDDATFVSPDLNGEEQEGMSLEKYLYIDKEKVDSLCNSYRINPNNLFLAVTSFVLSKFVYKKDVLIATLSNGRYTKAQENTLAMMVKTLPLALKLNTDLSIRDYFDYINDEWLNVLTYSSYPLTKISNEYDIMPEFLYTYQGMINENIEIASKSVKWEFIEFSHLKFNMGVQVEDLGDEYKIICQYNNQLYSEELINTFADSFAVVLNKFISYDEKTPLNTISIIEKDAAGIDDVEYEEIPEYRINRIFENQVELNPDRVVLYATDGEFTYVELNEKANKIANSLIKRGVEPEDRVMFILNRNSNVIASVFGILKSGAAFIPVDSDYPSERIEHVLTDSESKFIIVDDVIEKKGIDLSEYADNLLDVNELLEESDISNPNPDINANNMAYLIYTSGSTGLPKGVILEHGNIANFAYPHPKNLCTYELVHNLEKEDYKVLSTTTVAFDVFQQELMGSLLNGVPMVFANDIEYKDPMEMMDLIHRSGANVYISTPSRLLQYLEIEAMQETMYGFKVYIHAGEPFSQRLYELLSQNSEGKIFNMYGPTETTVYCNGQLLDSPDISVGKEMFNVYELIMDEDSNPLPPNVIGELYIGGLGVSREYLNRPEKNAESYVEINGVRFYKSGDFAKLVEDGRYYIFGRMDNQIKLRGLRIEIGEIEAGLAKYPGIKSVAVVVCKIKNNDHLCAYFTVHDEYKNENRGENEYSIDIADLKASLAEKLVYYMVPTVYMELDEIPQTLNGKTDLKNLPEPVLITEYVAPKNDVEAFFTQLFTDILGLDKVSATDNFFEIGGTSLLVSKITMEALNRNYDISYGDVFANPTPQALAEFILSDDLSESKSEMNYDYTKINELLKKNNLESLINGEIEDSLGNILLTGATGFLGIHVLRDIIENEEGEIYCFVRANKALSGVERLKLLLFYYFSKDYEEVFNTRLHVVEGDITSSADFEKLVPYKIDTVINCAANVKHFSSGTDIEDINYGGVINGLKFAKMKNAKYVQVSTYSIAGESIDNYPPLDVKFSETDLYIGQNVDNQYINSKFLAERAILEAAAEDGLSVKIMRVGNLMARSSDSEFQINFESNGFINRLKAFVTIGKMPYSMLAKNLEFSPIDTTARSIIQLSKTPKECVVFHPYDYHSVTFGDIIDIIKPLGLNIDPVEEEDYHLALDEALADKTKQEGVSGLITTVGYGKTRSSWVPVENAYTIQASYRLGIKWPFISEEYIYNFIKYLDELDFFGN